MSQSGDRTTTPSWSPSSSWWPRRPAVPVLPAPTATELAAIRVRVDASAPAITGHRRVWMAVTVAVVIAVVVTLFIIGTGAGSRSRAALLWAVVVVVGARIAASLADHRRQCRVDAAVRSRLATDPAAATAATVAAVAAVAADMRRPLLPLGPVGHAVAGLGLLGSIGLAVSIATAVPAVLRESGPVAALAPLVLLAVFLAAAAAAVHALRTPPVGAGPVLEAVDVAVRRRRFLALVEPVPLFLGLFWAQVDDVVVDQNAVVLGCAGAALVAAVAAQLGRGSELLLQDYRLATVRDPAGWLRGAPV